MPTVSLLNMADEVIDLLPDVLDGCDQGNLLAGDLQLASRWIGDDAGQLLVLLAVMERRFGVQFGSHELQSGAVTAVDSIFSRLT